MLDFEIRRSGRRCAKTDREFRQGEVFYSVLIPEGSEVQRYDYCHEAWQGPPENAIGTESAEQSRRGRRDEESNATPWTTNAELQTWIFPA